jgi:hypothetical protein
LCIRLWVLIGDDASRSLEVDALHGRRVHGLWIAAGHG